MVKSLADPIKLLGTRAVDSCYGPGQDATSVKLELFLTTKMGGSKPIRRQG